MALVESLLTAIVRADGDALVMHVGDKPYVVAPTGPIELSSQGLNLQAMAGMVAQLLPPDAQRALSEFGAVEHELLSRPEMHGDRFTIVVARGGDDVWIELRRHRRAHQPAEAVAAPAVATAVAAVSPLAEPAEAPTEERELVGVAAAATNVTHSVSGGPGFVSTGAAGGKHGVYNDAVAETAVAAAETPAESEHAAEKPISDTPVVFNDAAADTLAAVADVPVEHAISGDEGQPSTPAAFDDPPVDQAAVDPTDVPCEPVAANVDLPGTPPMSDGDAVDATPAIPPAESIAHSHATPGDWPLDTGEESPGDRQDLVEAAGGRDSSLDAPEVQPVVTDEEPVFAASTEAAAAAMSEAVVSAKPEPVVSAAAAGVVIPMTRTLRIEVPPSPSSRRPPTGRSEIERLLHIASGRGATALYLTTDASPYIRVDADVRVLDGEPPLSAADVESAVLELMPETTREASRSGEPTEWISDLADIGSVRGSTFRDHRGPGAIFQLLSMRPIAADQLGLSAEIQALAAETEGLVLVATPRGHGKTTVLGSLVDLINRRQANYVITIEREVRVVHDHQHALISQREVRGTSDQMLAVARAALRENPDVLVIEDVSSPEIFQFALDAANSGLLVLASVTAPSTAAALTRLIGLCATDKRQDMQSLVAERLRGAVAQVLLRRTGGGRVAAREVVLPTTGIASMLGAGRLEELRLAIESDPKHGMVSLTEALVDLVRSGAIDLREAYRKADDRDALIAALKRENVDTASVEGLA